MEIQTTKGLIDESLLVKKITEHVIQNGVSTHTEYFLDDELVKRDIHIRLNKEE